MNKLQEPYRSEAHKQLSQYIEDREMCADAKKDLIHILGLIASDNDVMGMQAQLCKSQEDFIMQLSPE